MRHGPEGLADREPVDEPGAPQRTSSNRAMRIALAETALFVGIALVPVLVLQFLCFFQRADFVFHDLGQRLTPCCGNPCASVVVVLIDEKDLLEYGPWPFDRGLYARILNRLLAAGARAVGFDLLLIDRSRDRPQGDRALIEAVASAGDRVVFPFETRKKLEMRGTARLVETERIVGPFRELSAVLRRTGYVNIPLEDINPDGVLRRTYLKRTIGGRIRPGFALSLASILDASAGSAIEGDRPYRIGYRRGGVFTETHVRDILDGGAAAVTKGKLVLVGASAAALMDVKVTPVGPLPGVVLNAHVVRSIVEDSWIHEIDPARSTVLCLAVAAAVAVVSLILSPWTGIFLSLVFSITWAVASVAAMALAGKAVPVFGPGLAALAVAIALLLAAERRETRNRGESEPARLLLERAADRYEHGAYEQCIVLLQRARRSRVPLSDESRMRRAEVLACKSLARMGESRLLDLSLDNCGKLSADLAYELALVLDDEGYFAHARKFYEQVYREDIGFRDVAERLSAIRKRAARGELVVNVKGVRELLGSRFSRVRHLAEGGMGVIFTAFDDRLGKVVAVKVLHPYLHKDERALKRMLWEVKSVRLLKHPNIVRIFDVEMGKAPFYTMEFCDGPTLAEILAGSVPERAEALSIAAAVARGMEHAHSRRVVHRDLKPENVIVTKSGVVKIIDFGVAKNELSRGLTRAGETVGTFRYMAPEQERGLAVGPAADVYSLGVIMREMNLGDLELVERMLDEDPAKRPVSVSAELDAILRNRNEGR